MAEIVEENTYPVVFVSSTEKAMTTIHVKPAGLGTANFEAAIKLLQRAIDAGEDLGDRRVHINALKLSIESAIRELDLVLVNFMDLKSNDLTLEQELTFFKEMCGSLLFAVRSTIKCSNDVLEERTATRDN